MLALIGANLIWSTSFAVGKQVMNELSPEVITFWRCALGAVFFIPGCRGQVGKVSSRDWSILVAMGVFGMGIPTLLQLAGLSFTLSANAAVLSSFETVSGVILASVLLREGWSDRKVMSLILAAVGAVLLSGGHEGGWSMSGPHLMGNAILILAYVLFSTYTLLAKPLAGRVPVQVMTLFPFLFAALALAPFLKGPFFPSTLTGWVGLLFLSVVCTAVAYALWNWGLASVEASHASMTLYLQPLVGGLIGAFVLKESLAAGFVASAALIILALVLMNSPQKAEADQEERGGREPLRDLETAAVG